jgi:hypothetical protein
MSNLVAIGVGLLGLVSAQTPGGGGPAARPATRVVEGRVTDTNGNPVREGKVMFGPQDPPLPFREPSTAAIDAPEGRYRVQVDSVDVAARQHVESTASEIVVPAGEGPLSLPPIRMTLAPFRALVGMKRSPRANHDLASSRRPWCQVAMAIQAVARASFDPGGGLAITSRKSGSARSSSTRSNTGPGRRSGRRPSSPARQRKSPPRWGSHPTPSAWPSRTCSAASARKWAT